MKTDYIKILQTQSIPDNGLRLGDGCPQMFLDNGMDEKNILEVENKVSDWLNLNDDDANQLRIGDSIYFQKSTITVKTCLNSWNVYNIATSGNWSKVISSKLICTISDNQPPSKYKMPNEVLSENYNRNKKFLKRLRSVVNSRRLKKIES